MSLERVCADVSEFVLSFPERVYASVVRFGIKSVCAYQEAPGLPESETARMSRKKIANDAKFRDYVRKKEEKK